MAKWIKTSLRKPEQGKKVLCFSSGDCDVRQRYKDYWFPIPYSDSRFAEPDVPEMWQEIDFPEGYTGHTKVEYKGELMTMDEFEKRNPLGFEEFCQLHLDNVNRIRNS